MRDDIQQSYAFRSADIIDSSRSNTILTDAAIQNIAFQSGIENGITSDNEGSLAVTGLLAVMMQRIKKMKPRACRYNVYSISFPPSMPVAEVYRARLQILPQNLNRKFLNIVNVPPSFGVLMLALFEEGPKKRELLTPQEFANYRVRSTGITPNSLNFGISPAPTTAITLIIDNIAAGGEFEGNVLIIEGV